MNRTRLHWALIAGSAAAIGVGAALGTRAVVQIVDATLPDARGIANFNRPGTITLLASNGQVIQKLGPATREKVKPGKMPLLVQQAFIAAEDRRFYDHDGIDAWGVARALVTNLKEGAVREGASTITQQLARTVFLSQDRTITRKLKEAALAMKLERQLSKQQILEQYLNYVYLGSSAYGVADAAWVYFSKQPDQLTAAEAALIAGMPPAPSVYSPLVNPDIARQRRAIVLDRMAQAGFITPGEAAAAKQTPLNLKPATPKYFLSLAPYFTNWVAQELPKILSLDQLEVGGLNIRTSLNLNWQKEAQQVIRQNAPGGLQGALVAMEPGTGLVRALVGGKDFNASQFNRASQALRSPGSTFKLFAYTAAVSAGLKPEDSFSNQQRCYPADNFCIEGKGGTSSMVNGLAMSMNAFAVDVAEKTGYERVIQTARKLGLTEDIGAYPAMVLGSNEQTVLDMTAAYAGIANRGMFVKPTPFEEIRGPNGEVVWSRRVDGDRGSRAVDSEVADAVNWMLQRVVTSGTGTAAMLQDRQVAGKTGTSEGARDLWFIGSVPQLTTSVWFGYDSNMKTGSSSGQAAWAWNQFMTKIKGGIPVSYFPQKPVLNRKFTPPGKKKAQRNQEAPYRGYEYEPVPRFEDSPYAPPDYPTEPYAAPAPAPDYGAPAAPAPEPAYEAPPPPAYEPPPPAYEPPPPAAEGPRNWLVPQVQER